MDQHIIGVGLLGLINLLGLFSALHAIMRSNSPQGAIAWAMGLLFIPYLTLILYWTVGRNHLHSYVTARQSRDQKLQILWRQVERQLRQHSYPHSVLFPQLHSAERLARLPLLNHNCVQLLLNGQASFHSILQGLKNAKFYICFQFYIIKNDSLGRTIQQLLMAKARAGLQVYFLYDRIGSLKLKRSYVKTLRQAGVQCHDFSLSGLSEPLRINFRNHRKLVIVDGHSAWLGGHNIGDEYLGRGDQGFWRDTHIRLNGPAVLACQLTFVEDWHWVTGQLPTLNWQASESGESESGSRAHANEAKEADESVSSAALQTAQKDESGESRAYLKRSLPICHDIPVLIIPSGPADSLDTARLMFVHAINTAHKRIWVASPYFVPDQSVISALVLAALRGVDVRIMVPDKPDHWLVYLSSFAFFDEASATGAKIYRYRNGFLHHKILILDDHVSAVGTANLDNRSLHLNFEITAMIIDEKLHRQMCQAFEADLTHCDQLEPLAKHGFWFRVLVHIAHLFAPLL